MRVGSPQHTEAVKDSMDIQSLAPMPTRPCKFCLALQDDAVFADFDINPNNCLYLVRISFDGYGCCNVQFTAGRGLLSYDASCHLIKSIESGQLNTPEVADILKTYFQENKSFLWEDALYDHALI